ncbi:bifunctional RNase H/acid phosphatase [Caballeronia catudaia]|uniref:Bifunctional RNase H/acid phosphatase n=1 Tax=Caballeronia catudaia TaxID=1777136 RepID=A0A158D079_9BURK|nr:reverse transcriptase-like protein [Caballeronia catudaia]SAK87871.1 bifunctional RNase H/acid phosphatase [Caballeronia catudaia]
MIAFEELLTVAYKKERLQSRRLARGASISEHTALVRTLQKAAGEQSLHDLIDARRAAQNRHADAQRLREARRAERVSEAKQRKARIDTGGWRGWFDGSALPNPGRLGVGGVLAGPLGTAVEISVAAGTGDSSLAEYLALIALLEAALRERAVDIVIYGDSRVVIDDMSAPHDAGIRSLAHHAARARALIALIGEVRLQWIPRARNVRADELSRAALESTRASAEAA